MVPRNSYHTGWSHLCQAISQALWRAAGSTQAGHYRETATVLQQEKEGGIRTRDRTFNVSCARQRRRAPAKAAAIEASSYSVEIYDLRGNACLPSASPPSLLTSHDGARFSRGCNVKKTRYRVCCIWFHSDTYGMLERRSHFGAALRTRVAGPHVQKTRIALSDTASESPHGRTEAHFAIAHKPPTPPPPPPPLPAFSQSSIPSHPIPSNPIPSHLPLATSKGRSLYALLLLRCNGHSNTYTINSNQKPRWTPKKRVSPMSTRHIWHDYHH